MRFLSEPPLDEFLNGPLGHHALSVSKTFLLIGDSGAKTAMAKELAIRYRFPLHMVFTERGIWPSAELVPLLDLVLRGLGESRSISEIDVAVFYHNERELFTVFLAAVLYFIWGCEIVEHDVSRKTTISHDEWICVSASDLGSVEELTEHFQRMKLQEIR